jgi:hypothetical protein
VQQDVAQEETIYHSCLLDIADSCIRSSSGGEYQCIFLRFQISLFTFSIILSPSFSLPLAPFLAFSLFLSLYASSPMSLNLSVSLSLYKGTAARILYSYFLFHHITQISLSRHLYRNI